MTFQRLALAASLLALAIGPATAAGGTGDDATSTAPDSRLELAMTLYAGGVTMGKVDMDATVRGSQYHVVSNLETSGLVNAFWKAQIQATSSGSIGAHSIAPTLYDSFAINRQGKKQQVSLTYGAGGAAPRLFADPVYETTGYEVKPDEQKNTFDPLSAVMSIVSESLAQPNNPCALTAPVFDGKRRYDIAMNKVRDIDIKMDNGLYAGKGLLCQIRYKQLAGYKPTILRNKDAYPAINVWITQVKSNGRDYAVPVKVWADTSFGTVSAVASALKVDGAPAHPEK